MHQRQLFASVEGEENAAPYPYSHLNKVHAARPYPTPPLPSQHRFLSSSSTLTAPPYLTSSKYNSSTTGSSTTDASTSSSSTHRPYAHNPTYSQTPLYTRYPPPPHIPPSSRNTFTPPHWQTHNPSFPPNTTPHLSTVKQRMRPHRDNDSYSERQALFSSSGRGGKRDLSDQRYDAERHAQAYTTVMEQENDKRVEALSAKVSQLKTLGQSIREEIHESDTLLTRMGTTFDNVGPMLSGTLHKLQNILRGGGGWHMWWIMIFVVVLIFLLYLLSRGSGR